MKRRDNGQRIAREREKGEMWFSWSAFSVAVTLCTGIAWVTQNTDAATAVAAVVASLLGAIGCSLLEKYGDRIWNRL